MRKKLVMLMIMFGLLLGACTQSENLSNKEKVDVTLVLDWSPNTNHTGIYVAEQMKFFEEVGLNVKIIQPPADGAELMVASGQADFGISFQDTLAASFAEKLPVKAIASIMAHNTSGIVTLSDKKVTRAKQLEGLTYATWDLPIEKAMVKQIITDDGGNADKLKMEPNTVTDIVSALQTTVDAVWVYEGWDGVAVKNAGLQTNFLSFRELNPAFDYYTPVLITNEQTLQHKSEVVKKLLSALSKGYTYAAKHPKESADMLLKKVPELDRQLVEQSQEFVSKYYLDEGKPWGYIDKERWGKFYKWLNEQHILKENIDEYTGFTNDFIAR
ncbi:MULTISPECIES: ABC transporter substrate-binding protein [unclassified Granulicatella]|uniref:ABC transporter substrate-binding protein n=1 Tax=unclassified Granulicatella TaxID=2630493 RepID=UPI0010744F10|nr:MULTISPECIES: ABC transporter substrate-binding protein [unclassified Granulicatella]MBF0780030.1 ABC transporter substrate-binding protein [Granulicatella sp. 19428wC4_WM01]TFU95879.1 ABC transporter substrate-binding protein [Granulicatella sp. WM01]